MQRVQRTNWLGSWLTELGNLVIPVECPGCGCPDVKLCKDCGTWLDGPLRQVEAEVPRLDTLDGSLLMPVWALGAYVGPARGMVVAWKDKGREDLTRVYSAALTYSLRQHRRTKLFPTVDILVPMPSSAGSVRHRGRDHLAPLGKRLGGELQVPMVRALTKHATRDQVGLSARARGEARITVRRLRSFTPGARVLLFDDVVTTGATLAAARAALTAKGCEVVGAIVLAATPPRNHARSNIYY